MLICPNATKNYVDIYVKTQALNYTKYFCYVETKAEMQEKVMKIQKIADLQYMIPAYFHAFCDKTYYLTQYFEI